MHLKTDLLLTPPNLNNHQKNWKRNIFGLAISIACLIVIFRQINYSEVRSAILNFQWAYLCVGIISLTFGYSLRILRWSVLLKSAGAGISPTKCIAPFLGSITLNNILPMRLGDVIRALVFPSSIGVEKIIAAGSLVMERLVDLMTLLTCLAIGHAVNPAIQFPDWLTKVSLSFASIGGVSLMLLFLFSGYLSNWCARLIISDTKVQNKFGRIMQKILTVLSELLGSFAAMSRFSILLKLFVLSMLVWVGEAGLFWSLLLGFGFDVRPEIALFVMAMTTLSTLVPSSPGYVGPFHLAAFTAISILGGTSAQAASYAVLAHLSVWLPTTLAGAIAILLNPQLFGSAKLKVTTSL